ncbi:uncharacterized protein LOC106770199 [Vigna radiata var. radiata]|uniref:Uncharacterized protein LOC106770199 n=1 Tax=Vigna radiata var. radiata TaxID=3916 RepID=A0A1S3UZI9_VIGRR|nr:uncharacterized protein LOC106770199 [Vigna radiata var. radiata]
MKVYVDDMVIRSRSVEEHVKDLEEVFVQVRKFHMRWNPSKCTFGVQTGKFLGFMLTAWGIETNHDKCRAVLEMRSLQRLVGRLTVLSRFIPRLVEHIKPIIKVMKKGAQVCWDNCCEVAFEEVKKILTEPPVMGQPEPNQELQVFLAISDEAINAALVQEEPELKLVYFVSRGLKEAEIRYQRVEKVALSLLYAARRLKPYFQGHQIVVQTDYPIAKVLRKPDLVGRLVGWSIKLSEFGLRYEPRGSVRGQHLAEFSVELLAEADESFCWKLSIDGSSNRQGRGTGVVLEGPNELMIEQSLIFKFKISNNQTEYEALLAGLELARDLGAEYLDYRKDSQLVKRHMRGTFQIKDGQLLQYFHKAKQLETCFRSIEIKHVPRKKNSRADMLSKLATGKEKGHLSSVIRQVLEKPTVECFNVRSLGGQTSWKEEIIRLIKEPDEGGSLQIEDVKKIARYCMVGDDLYRCGYTTPLLKCLDEEEAKYVMRELHEGICGRHTGGRALRARILRAGYFWITLEKDCMTFTQKFLACQKHGNVFHAPAAELNHIMFPWSFAQW